MNVESQNQAANVHFVRSLLGENHSSDSRLFLQGAVVSVT